MCIYMTIIGTVVLTNYTNNAYYCDTCDTYLVCVRARALMEVMQGL
jgi:hypothetical protein